MLTPSIYMYIIFISIVFYLVKEGYWNNSFTNLYTTIKSNLKLFLLTLSLTIFSILVLDLPISEYFSDRDNLTFLNHIIAMINNLGDGSFIFSLFTTLVIISLIIKKDKYRRILLISLSSAIYAGLFNLFLKIFFNRARPYVNLNPYKLFTYGNTHIFRSDYWSMPSGHTIVAFAAFIPLAIHSKNKILKFFFINLSILVAFARIYLFKHWLSDVIIAAFLGTMIGIMTYQHNNIKQNNETIKAL
ncbi:phosphatase PAP2 family protein [Orenia marismortui]|uniref:PAP2 superfamily protein n=1 Tax=Orenia marismortui TaxID=46469 RepID=A0A4R8H247_9FIRM|nr:phosphatase PAP2 family protein [Orenia marismortui]TDX52393.1 PAP2 superfamily protein [Orenia marismortui]